MGIAKIALAFEGFEHALVAPVSYRSDYSYRFLRDFYKKIRKTGNWCEFLRDCLELDYSRDFIWLTIVHM